MLDVLKEITNNARNYQDDDIFLIWEGLSTHDKNVLNLMGVGTFGKFWSTDCSSKLQAAYAWPIIPGKSCNEGDVSFHQICLDEIWNGKDLEW